ncbi:hypothetical protein [Mycobacterium tilburgii]|uniref:hypothetical protein n=1 Tax=Mycobacterium tilburgii TaxID=44467 RepID=UPI0021B27639|nr:hypothetical protein [Mycobacterium tilburgii]
MVDGQRLLAVSIEHLIDAVQTLDQAGYPGDVGIVAHVDMDRLVVDDGEGPRCPWVQVLPALLGVDI